MKKKLVAVLAVVTMLGLVGCKEEEQAQTPFATPTAGGMEEVKPTEAPELTEEVTPTEVPELTEELIPTVTPESTVTSEPTMALAPTATATPELIATPVPTVVPEPTAMPVPTATPALTVMPEPTATPQPAVKIGEMKEADVLEEGESFIQCGSGVIITKKDGLYGAVSVDGKEIVEHVYASWYLEPNVDGQFALGNEEAVFCFDAKGNVIYTIKEDLMRLHINEDYITYIYYVPNEKLNRNNTKLGVYDIKKEKLLEIEQPTVNVAEVTPVVDGKFYVTWAWYDATQICEIDVKTLEQKDTRYDWWCEYLNPRAEYGAIKANCFGNHWVGILSTDGTKEYRADILEMIAAYEIPSNNGCNYKVIDYRNEGINYFNRGKQIVIYIMSNDDGSEHYFLVDFSKAEVEEKQIKNDYGYEVTQPVVTNLKDVIVACYDDIYLSASGNYLASEDGDWFYINEKGEVIADYADCSDFVGDYALVIEDDGMAYVVDTGFNKVSKGYPAEGVYASGDALCVENGEEITYLFVSEQ